MVALLGGVAMIDGKIPERLDLQFKNPPESQSEKATSADPSQPCHQQAGPSSLYGRVGDNMTYHTPGAYKAGFFSRLWHWAWKDLFSALLGLLRVFMPTRPK